MSAPKQVLVTCGTGNIGKRVATLLKKEGISVRVATRDAEGSAAETLKKSGVDIYVVDFDDEKSLEAAVDGCDTVVFISPFSADHQGVTEQWISAFEEKKESIKHITRLSMLGAGDPQHLCAKWHALDEVLTRVTDIPTTIVRPSIFTQTLAFAIGPSVKATKGTVYFPLGDTPIAYIDAADVAQAITKIVKEGESHYEKTYDLKGAVAVTPKQVSSYVEKSVGKKINYVEIPIPQFKESLVGAWTEELVAEGIAELLTSIEGGESEYSKGDDSVFSLVGSVALTPEQYVADRVEHFQF